MKRIFSILITAAMLLTAFCVPCVYAEAENGNPYVYMDFEEDNVAELVGNKVLTGGFSAKAWKADGANSTKGCISYTQKAGQPEELVNTDFAFEMGKTYRVSVWVRYVTDLKGYSPVVSFFLNTVAKTGENAWKEQAMVKKATVGEWNYYTCDFVWDGSVWAKIDGAFTATTSDPNDKPMQFRLRVGSSAGGLYEELKKKEPYADDTAFAAQFDVDDLTVEPLVEKPDAEETAGLYNVQKLTYSTFDNPYPGNLPFYSGYQMGKDAGANKAQFISSAKDPATAESGPYLNIKSPDGAYAFNEFMFNADEHANILWSANHMYEISFQFRSRKMVTKNNTTAQNGHMAIKIQSNSATLTTTDVNGLTGIEAWPIMPNMNVLPLDGQWHEIKLPFKFELKTFAELYRNGVPLQIGLIPYINSANRWDGVNLDIDIDDLYVKDLGPVANGDFETGSGSATRTYRGKSAPSHGVKQYEVFGWNTENATAAQSTDVREEATGKNSMKVTVGEDGGYVWQGIALEKDIETYRVSFWAKGPESLADGEEIPFAMVLDRNAAVTEQAQEYYDTPNFEFYTGADSVIKSDTYSYSDSDKEVQEWKLTNQWQYYTCEVSNVFDAIPGHESVNTSKIKPRQPFMYFDVDGNGAATEYFLDDFVLEEATEKTEFAYPYIENANLLSGELVSGETVTAAYGFVSDSGMAEKETVARLMISEKNMNMWATQETISANGGEVSFVLPASAVGKQAKIVFSPVDENNLFGVTETLELGEVKEAFTVAPAISGWDETNSVVNGSAKVEINLSAVESQKITVILAVYNEKNKMVATAVKTETVAYGDSVTIPVSASFAGKDASHAKLFVWSGESAQTAGKTAYCDEISSVR